MRLSQFESGWKLKKKIQKFKKIRNNEMINEEVFLFHFLNPQIMILIYLLTFILSFYAGRAIVMLFMVFHIGRVLNKRLILIADSLPDKQSVVDLEIALNKLEWHLDNVALFEDFIHIFRTIDTNKWINPELIYLLYEYYKVK